MRLRARAAPYISDFRAFDSCCGGTRRSPLKNTTRRARSPSGPSRSDSFVDFYDFVRDQTMRLPVHGHGRLPARGLDQAENLATAFVEPILEVLDPRAALDAQVLLVGAGHRIGGESVDSAVVVHVQGHCATSLSRFQPGTYSSDQIPTELTIEEGGLSANREDSPCWRDDANRCCHCCCQQR